MILPKGEFDKQWGKQGRLGGQENDVYISDDGITVMKRNDLTMHASYVEFFERLVLHNHLFPENKLRFLGFDDSNGTLKPVTSQEFVTAKVGETHAARAALWEEIKLKLEQHLTAAGFIRFKPGTAGYNSGPEGYNYCGEWYHPRYQTIIEDLHDENVVLDGSGNLNVIDPVIFPKPPNGSATEMLLQRQGLLQNPGS